MPRASTDRRNRSGRFHMRAKAFFLTFPQANSIQLQQIFDHFKDSWEHQASRTKPQDVLVAKEAHADGTPHFHVFLRFPARIDILSANAFDFQGHHCNAQSARSPKKVIQYCVKDGDFLSTFHVPIKKTPKQILDESNNTREFIDAALEQGGWQTARSFQNIKKLAEYHFEEKQAESKVCQPVFDITSFVNVPDKIQEFIHNISERQPGGRDRVKSLWIWGNTRLGKTALAESLGKHSRIANVWNFESLDTTGTAQYLILDDISWDSWKYQYKTLLGCQRDVTFTGKYKKPTKFVFGIPAIVLSNELPFFSPEEMRWMEGNVDFVEIINKLY